MIVHDAVAFCLVYRGGVTLTALGSLRLPTTPSESLKEGVQVYIDIDGDKGVLLMMDEDAGVKGGCLKASLQEGAG